MSTPEPTQPGIDLVGALRVEVVDALTAAVARTRKLLGSYAPDLPAGVSLADAIAIRRFAEATGDDRPLHNSLRYGVSSSIHKTMLAPPAFVLAVRMPDSAGGLDLAEHPLVHHLSEIQVIWEDHIRLADRVAGQVWPTAARLCNDAAPPRALIRSEMRYTRDELPLAEGYAEVVIHSRDDCLHSFPHRSVHRYDDEAIAKLVSAMETQGPSRGAATRFWREVDVDNNLPEVIRGPLTFSELMTWAFAEGRPIKSGNLHRRYLAQFPGRRATHPTTGWPDWDRREADLDVSVSSHAGQSAPAAPGGLLFALAAQYLGDWMGDDAFLRRLHVRILQPMLYGDALRFTGTVVEKYEMRGAQEARYTAVTITLRASNQLGEPVIDGDAAVFFPEPGRPVVLPLRGGLTWLGADGS